MLFTAPHEKMVQEFRSYLACIGSWFSYSKLSVSAGTVGGTLWEPNMCVRYRLLLHFGWPD